VNCESVPRIGWNEAARSIGHGRITSDHGSSQLWDCWVPSFGRLFGAHHSESPIPRSLKQGLWRVSSSNPFVKEALKDAT